MRLGVSLFLCLRGRLLQKPELLLQACQLVLAIGIVAVTFQIFFEFYYFVLDLLDGFRRQSLFVSFLGPLLFVALEFLLSSLFVVLLHRIRRSRHGANWELNLLLLDSAFVLSVADFLYLATMDGC